MDTPHENISTRHRPPGDAARPTDTGRDPAKTTQAEDWQPGEDEGKSSPASKGEDA